VISGDATYTNLIVFGLIRSGFEPTIYRNRDEHANHYTTNAISNDGEAGNYRNTNLVHYSIFGVYMNGTGVPFIF
jgi:hypothetical protein